MAEKINEMGEKKKETLKMQYDRENNPTNIIMPNIVYGLGM